VREEVERQACKSIDAERGDEEYEQ